MRRTRPLAHANSPTPNQARSAATGAITPPRKKCYTADAPRGRGSIRTGPTFQPGGDGKGSSDRNSEVLVDKHNERCMMVAKRDRGQRRHVITDTASRLLFWMAALDLEMKTEEQMEREKRWWGRIEDRPANTQPVEVKFVFKIVESFLKKNLLKMLCWHLC